MNNNWKLKHNWKIHYFFMINNLICWLNIGLSCCLEKEREVLICGAPALIRPIILPDIVTMSPANVCIVVTEAIPWCLHNYYGTCSPYHVIQKIWTQWNVKFFFIFAMKSSPASLLYWNSKWSWNLKIFQEQRINFRKIK